MLCNLNTLLLFTVFLFFLGCKNKSQVPIKKVTYIAIIPLNNWRNDDISFIQKNIQDYFKKSCIVKDVIRLPNNFLNTEKGLRYSADSIISHLASLKNDSVLTYVALTNEDIFTTIKDENGAIMKPIEKYKVWGIFGLGYMPGKACVISSKRLYTSNTQKYQHRIRTVVLHEIGHNLGLPHCPTINCIMSDANEKISTVDHSSSDMCKSCSAKINLD